MVSNFFIGTSLEIVSCLQWAIISQWISSHRFHAAPYDMRLPSDAFSLGEGAAKGWDRQKHQLSNFCMADMGDCSKYRILQMAVM